MTQQRKLLLSALIAAGFGLANAAQAATATLYNDLNLMSSFSSTVTITGSGTANNVTTGNYTLYDATNPASWNQFIAYCFQPLQEISIDMAAAGMGIPVGPGLDYSSSTTLTVADTATPLGAATQANVHKLFDLYYADSLTSAVKSAGFQLALWEVEHETIGSFSLATGDFQASNVVNNEPGGPAGSEAVAAANGYMNLSGPVAGHYVLTQWVNATSQDFISADQYAPIPEPASLALMALGLAGLAASRGRKLH